MFTAIVTGIILSSISIFVYRYMTQPYVFGPVLRQIEENPVEEGEEDPIYSSHISNSVIYSANNDFEISERGNDQVPIKSSRNISAKSYLVINMTDNHVIFQKNQDTIMPLASITKLVTAVLARKLINQNKYITITPEMTNAYGNDARFRIGEKLTAEELLYPLLMLSSNDAAEALAISYSGGKKLFMKEMNNWVNSIGAYQTYFRDPSGMSAQNLSTSKDIAIITKWILENDPEVFEITKIKSKTIRTHTWVNPTYFLNLTVYAGGKNGYTSAANRTGVSLFKLGKNEELFLVILLGSSMRNNDTLDLLDEAVN